MRPLARPLEASLRRRPARVSAGASPGGAPRAPLSEALAAPRAPGCRQLRACCWVRRAAPHPGAATGIQAVCWVRCGLCLLAPQHMPRRRVRAQVDERGDVNVSSMGPMLRIGCGGFIDISQSARRVVFVGTLRSGGSLARPRPCPRLPGIIVHTCDTPWPSRPAPTLAETTPNCSSLPLLLKSPLHGRKGTASRAAPAAAAGLPPGAGRNGRARRGRARWRRRCGPATTTATPSSCAAACWSARLPRRPRRARRWPT